MSISPLYCSQPLACFVTNGYAEVPLDLSHSRDCDAARKDSVGLDGLTGHVMHAASSSTINSRHIESKSSRPLVWNKVKSDDEGTRRPDAGLTGRPV